MAQHRGVVKIVEQTYKVGDIVKVKAILIHPMETGFAKDQHSGELKPRFYVKEAEVFYNDKRISWIEMDVATSQNPTIIFPVKVTGPGVLKVKFINSEGEVIEKSTKVEPKE